MELCKDDGLLTQNRTKKTNTLESYTGQGPGFVTHNSTIERLFLVGPRLEWLYILALVKED